MAKTCAHGNAEFYTLYNATLAMYQSGGENWNHWNDAVRDAVVANQTKGSGCDRGSWDPRGALSRGPGRPDLQHRTGDADARGLLPLHPRGTGRPWWTTHRADEVTAFMSLLRTVYLGAVICGWMAFGGWLAAEILRQGVVQGARRRNPVLLPRASAYFLGSRTIWARLLRREKNQTIAAFCLVGAAIGAGLGLAGGLSNWQLGPQILRMLRGLIAGGLGGFAGGWLGAMIYQIFASGGGGVHGWVRPVGWMAAGGLVGLADGLITLSPNRMRNGLIGGLIRRPDRRNPLRPDRRPGGADRRRERSNIPLRDHQPRGGIRGCGPLHRRRDRAHASVAQACLADRPRRRPTRPPGDSLRQQA